MHGRTSKIVHDATSVLTGLPSPLRAARYHSLVIAPESLPDSLRVFATSADDGEIMAVAHRTHPVVGVQFHPESAASEHGYAMLERFLRGDAARPTPPRADGAHETARAIAPWGSGDDETTFVPPPVEQVR